MGDLTKNFSRHEFACECGCGFDTVDYMLLIILQDLADHFGQPVAISGGNRCFTHNLATKGARRKSTHMEAKAADIKVEDTNPLLVYNYLTHKYPNSLGLGLYWNRVHVDSRDKAARWKKV